MTNDDLRGLLQRISRLCSTFQDELVVFGSAAIVLNGIELGRPVADLDLFASDATFSRLSDKFSLRYKQINGGTAPYIVPIEGLPIEILTSFPGVRFENVHARAQPSDAAVGFRLGTLADLRTWKLAHRREKDMRDIDAMDRAR